MSDGDEPEPQASDTAQMATSPKLLLLRCSVAGRDSRPWLRSCTVLAGRHITGGSFAM